MIEISPSKLVLDAVGLPDEGPRRMPAGQTGRCAMCGVTIPSGASCGPLRTTGHSPIKDSFTNHSAMAHPLENLGCGACLTILDDGAFLNALGRGVASAAGFFPISKDVHRAWALLAPPEPPFVMMLQASNQQHTVWRAPVSLSRDMYFLRLGDQVLRIRRKVLIEAKEACIAIDAREQVPGDRPRKRKTDAPRNPFDVNRDGKSLTSGEFSAWYRHLHQLGRILPEEHTLFSSMTAGEVWAMHAVLVKPERPEPLSY